jgi:RHS repeat-associated protein
VIITAGRPGEQPRWSEPWTRFSARTRLDLIGARQYDPATGRFLSVDPVLDHSKPQTLGGYTYAAGNPVTQADPSGLLLPGGAQCGIDSNDPCNSGGGNGGGGGGNGGGGGGGSTTPSCPLYLAGCPGFTGGGAGQGGEQPYGPGYSPVPDVHPVAARYTSPASAAGRYLADCNGIVARLGGCPSERGAAGTTPQEVKQSALGALGILLGVLPIGDLLDGAEIGGWLSQLLEPNTIVHAAVDDEGLLARLPAYSEGGKTSGILVNDGAQTPLTSGYDGAASSIPRGTSGFSLLTRAHVEGQAAAIMRQQSMEEATLYVNNAPCLGVQGCDYLLPRMLPEDAQLRVVAPGFVRTYLGLPDDLVVEP